MSSCEHRDTRECQAIACVVLSFKSDAAILQINIHVIQFMRTNFLRLPTTNLTTIDT